MVKIGLMSLLCRNILGVGCLLFLAACGVSSVGNVDVNLVETAVSTPAPTNLETIPDIDITQHSVPLEEIVFDTFRSVNRAVPLTEADTTLIHSLRDAIPPIYEPVFETAASASIWLDNRDTVLGYVAGEEAYAYPVKILNFHEIVSHTVNGRPIIATYCPLCFSGIVYDRTVNGKVLLFGNTSALYESDMVMLDHQTGSYWVQVSGKAVVGSLTDAQLEPLPSQMSSWQQWQTLYPETKVLSRDTGFSRNYARDPFTGYPEQLNLTGSFAFPVSEAVQDARLEPGTLVFAVQINNETHAYPVENRNLTVLNEMLEQTAVIVIIQVDAGVAYRSVVNGRLLTFTVQNSHIMDNETGSTWNFAGQAVAGELNGTQLEPLPTRTALWFALIAAFPNLTLHQP
ncbi:MAG: DUF3179 domain-containing protein [Chloroflexi bacterium]|nr:DUF3179 domain-containing protein [Chloroflexota bacterium]